MSRLGDAPSPHPAGRAVTVPGDDWLYFLAILASTVLVLTIVVVLLS